MNLLFHIKIVAKINLYLVIWALNLYLKPTKKMSRHLAFVM